MKAKLSQRDKRALKFGAVCVPAILLFAFAASRVGHWAKVKESLDAKRKDLKAASLSGGKQEGLFSIVPVFEMPQEEEKQKYLFRTKLNEQLKEAGVKGKPLQVLATTRSPQAGYKLLRVKCTGKCNFGQILDLLAKLKENPYLVGVEEFQMKCDPKKRKEFELSLTVSTLVKTVE